MPGHGGDGCRLYAASTWGWGGVAAAKAGGSGPGLLSRGLECSIKVQSVMEHN